MKILMQDINKVKEELTNLKQKTCKNRKGIEYIDNSFSFDIETSNFYENIKTKKQKNELTEEEKKNKNWEKRAIMYLWSFCLNSKKDVVIIGRTWYEFHDLLRLLISYFRLNKKRRIMIFVHNLSYEFAFIENMFTWDNVFSISNRRPIYAVTDFGIEFRCSYLLSGYSLETLAKNLTSHKIEKLEGKLKYDLIRHSATPISDEELDYSENDALIVAYYIDELKEEYRNLSRLALTKTGFVRNYCRKRCLNSKSKYYNYYYKSLMKNQTINNLQEFKLWERAYCGGFTHANAVFSGKVLENVDSYDITSSYPTSCIAEKFPMSRGKKVKVKNLNEFEKYLSMYACVFDIKFTNLQSKEYYENYLSRSKCEIRGSYNENNGRLTYAEICTTTLTDVDYSVVKNVYDWDSIDLGDFYIYEKAYLPKNLIISILEFYKDKTELKGVAGREREYLNAKEKVNSIYGMMVTSPLRETIHFENGVWYVDKGNDKEKIESYNKSKRRFLNYLWGVYVTAYSRRNIWFAIYNCKKDYLYCDTDSIKITNGDNYKDFFEFYNNRIKEKIRKTCEFHDIDYLKYCEPKTKKGFVKPLGVFDFEGRMKYFKSLGAKRYVYIDSKNELHTTIAGVNKASGQKYLLELAKKDVVKSLDYFTDNLYFPANKSGKLCLTYFDNGIKGKVTDYLGNTEKYEELSFVHMEKSSYSLSLSENYKNYLLGIRYLEGVEGVDFI